MNATAPIADDLLFFERAPWSRRWLWFSFSALVLAVDFITGPYILFPVFFVLPVMLVAWNCSFRCALVLAILLCSVRFGFHYLWGFPWTIAAAVINTFMRCCVLVLLAWITATLASRTRSLRERIATLEGIVPICASCKDIRDESGQWHRMERYVSERSRAQFSHGVCPKCAEKLYGEFLRK